LEQIIYEMKVKKDNIHIEVPNLQRHWMEIKSKFGILEIQWNIYQEK
jgi:hypothetical protein